MVYSLPGIRLSVTKERFRHQGLAFTHPPLELMSLALGIQDIMVCSSTRQLLYSRYLGLETLSST